MIYSVSSLAIIVFTFFVALVLGLSFYFARKAKSASGYFAAGGQIHWAVNGVAFAGDYLSAASFLGICGMIAYYGFDGFIYSIGYLAGWVVALFLVAEPLKRLGKYTFADALDSRFNSPAIKLTAAISTLVVSIFYLIPQMVGAGAIVTPLLGFPHWLGVVMVGSIVIFIVATAGMTSTTYVQFIKGGLLIIFSVALTFFILQRGVKRTPTPDFHEPQYLQATLMDGRIAAVEGDGFQIKGQHESNGHQFIKLNRDGVDSWWKLKEDRGVQLEETLSVVTTQDGQVLYNGAPKEAARFYQVGHASKIVQNGQEVSETGPLGPFEFIRVIEASEIVLYSKINFTYESEKVTLYHQKPTPGSQIMKPGLYYNLDQKGSLLPRIDFFSLMLALFMGTSALPHVLIRYYTVPSQRAARKSTIVAIACIGFFYMLTLYIGTGAMFNGGLDLSSSNMSAPLLAKTFGVVLFSVISAIAFATILGTVSGLIVATSGAVAHDLMDKYMKIQMTENQKVKAGRIAAVAVGIVAILLGIIFEKQNVSFLVALAFAIAASANLPAILMLLFWKKTTAKGIAWAIITGMGSALLLILLSPTMFEVYGLNPSSAIFPLHNPGIISIPLGFMTLIVVSLISRKKEKTMSNP